MNSDEQIHGTQYLCFLTVGYWWEGNHSTFSIHETRVVIFAIQQLQIPTRKSRKETKHRKVTETAAGHNGRKQ